MQRMKAQYNGMKKRRKRERARDTPRQKRLGMFTRRDESGCMPPPEAPADAWRDYLMLG